MTQNQHAHVKCKNKTWVNLSVSAICVSMCSATLLRIFIYWLRDNNESGTRQGRSQQGMPDHCVTRTVTVQVIGLSEEACASMRRTEQEVPVELVALQVWGRTIRYMYITSYYMYYIICTIAVIYSSSLCMNQFRPMKCTWCFIFKIIIEMCYRHTAHVIPNGCISLSNSSNMMAVFVEVCWRLDALPCCSTWCSQMVSLLCNSCMSIQFLILSQFYTSFIHPKENEKNHPGESAFCADTKEHVSDINFHMHLMFH